MNPVSICVIMKNEEKHLDNFLSSIEKCMTGYPYEIILVDTGSTDRSVEIAKSHGITVHKLEWKKDFSYARNHASGLASYDKIIALDCDEYVRNVDFNSLEAVLLAKENVAAINISNHFNGNDGDEIYTTTLPRIYDRTYCHFEGAVHEQIVPISAKGIKPVCVEFGIEHFGYAGTKEEMEEKAQRNAELLLEELKTKPDNPYTYFQLGQCYNMIHDDEKAAMYYSKGLSYDVDEKAEYVQMMVTAYGYNLLHLGKTDEALGLVALDVYEAFCENSDYLCMAGLIYMRTGLFMEAMQEFLKATTIKKAHTEGTNSYVPLFNMGQINEILENPEGAKLLYAQCGDYPPAKERLKELSN